MNVSAPLVSYSAARMSAPQYQGSVWRIYDEIPQANYPSNCSRSEAKCETFLHQLMEATQQPDFITSMLLLFLKKTLEAREYGWLRCFIAGGSRDGI